MIQSLLDEAGLARRDLDGIAVGRGPGAFTGVRLAISVAQGLALGLDVPVVPVSSLAALALDASAEAECGNAAILATIDARMGEIYTGAFRCTPDGLVEAISDESVGAAENWNVPQTARLPAQAWCVVGTGWSAYADALTARLPCAPMHADGARYPQAHAVLRLALPQFARGAGLAPEHALPVYLRDKVALTLAEQPRR